MTLVEAIKLPDSFDAYSTKEETPIKFLRPTSTINIFVGSNNSGKSRFMRMLSTQAEYKTLIGEIDLSLINSQINAIFSQWKVALREMRIGEANGFSNQSMDELLPLPDSLSLNTDSYANLRIAFAVWREFPHVESITMLTGADISYDTRTKIRDEIQVNAKKALKILDQVPIHSSQNTPKRIYIPVLRGLRPIDDRHTDFYAERTNLDYFSSDVSSAPKVFTGLSLYDVLTSLLLGDNNERKIVSGYQEFISRTLFENKSVALIPNPKNKAVTVKIGSEKEQPIFHLGDGIQSAIILSFLPYITEEPTFFFIEEPEMYLHPGLQRKVLNFFAEHNSRHMFFLTTHSNHFLDLTIDIKNVSIFTFRKNLSQDEENDEQTPSFTIEAVDSGNNSSLELLGVRNSSVFLVNATIWVEGITDRWYLRKMLNSYIDHLEEKGSLSLRLEEDVHFSFVEYGGANITHWSFLDDEDHPIEVERLCAKALVVVDQDGDKKLKRKEKLAEILGDRLIVLPAREVENLLPYKVIKQVILEYEKTPDRQLPDISYNKYKNKYLGEFIESKILDSSFSRKGGYKDKSGTIKSKRDFCKKALPNINYIDFSQATQSVIETIYKFICSQNS
jgi:AAA domain, putative AbiEii toxin, Type IV TA system